MLSALVFTLFIGVSAVRDSEGDLGSANHEGCLCFDQDLCSSCDMQECPFVGGISWVKGFGTGGSDSFNGFAAWSVKAANGKYYVVKFGGVDTKKKAAVQTAQLAHALHVMTPRQLLIDHTSCASFWDDGFGAATFQDHEGRNAEATKDAFVRSLDDTRRECLMEDNTCEGLPKVAVQEHASFTVLPFRMTDIESSFWYQAGAISAFDWITGKSDLFNDLSLEWKDSVEEEHEAKTVNCHNIHYEKKRLMAIDLGINMGLVKWELWDQLLEEILSSSSAEDLTWVQKVLFPMLAMMRNGGEHERIEKFGLFNIEDLSGWDGQLSPWLTWLGLATTIQKALQMFSAADTAPAHMNFLASLTGLQHANVKLDGVAQETLSSKVLQLHDRVTREVEERKGASFVCCKVVCDKSWYNVKRSKCKVKSEHALMKLGTGLAFVDGFIKSVPETDCDDITAMRLSTKSQDKGTNKEARELLNQYCDCGDASKPRIALVQASRADCGGA